MTQIILEADERDLTEELLKWNDIYDEYIARSQSWITFLRSMAFASSQLKDDKGVPVVYTPKQIVRDCQAYLHPTAETLLSLIRKLKDAEDFLKSDLYSRLDQLEVRRIERADHKGLFLLTVRAAENNEVFSD